jgi:hypothetical protein
VYWGCILGGTECLAQFGEARCETSDDAVKSGDDARVHKICVDKATVKFFESGKIEIKTFTDRKYQTGNEIPDVGTTIEIKEDGNINITSSQQIQLKSPNILIDSDTFTLRSKTIKIEASDNVNLKSGKFMSIESTDKLDVKTTKEAHMNHSNDIWATG